MSIPLVPLVESLRGIESLSEIHALVAWFFAGFFLFLAVLDLSFLDLGGFVAKEKAQQAFIELLVVALSLIFGLYFVVPAVSIFLILILIWFISSVVKMLKLVFQRDERNHY